MAGDRRSQEESSSVVVDVRQTQFQLLIFGRSPVSQQKVEHDVDLWVGTRETTLRHRHDSQFYPASQGCIGYVDQEVPING